MIWLLTIGVMFIFAVLIGIGLTEDGLMYFMGLLMLVTFVVFSCVTAEFIGKATGLLP